MQLSPVFTLFRKCIASSGCAASSFLYTVVIADLMDVRRFSIAGERFRDFPLRPTLPFVNRCNLLTSCCAETCSSRVPYVFAA